MKLKKITKKIFFLNKYLVPGTTNTPKTAPCYNTVALNSQQPVSMLSQRSSASQPAIIALSCQSARYYHFHQSVCPLSQHSTASQPAIIALNSQSAPYYSAQQPVSPQLQHSSASQYAIIALNSQSARYYNVHQQVSPLSCIALNSHPHLRFHFRTLRAQGKRNENPQISPSPSLNDTRARQRMSSRNHQGL